MNEYDKLPYTFVPDPRDVVGSNQPTLRDYFAATAMNAVVASSERGFNEDWTADGIAKEAYFIADAMLAERARNNASEAAQSELRG